MNTNTRQTLDRRQWAGILMAFAGIVISFLLRESIAASFLLGIIFVLVGVVLVSGHTWFSHLQCASLSTLRQSTKFRH